MALQERRQRESEGGFPIWKLLTAGSLGGAALVVGVYLFAGDVEYVDAEARFDGVHLCAPEQQDEATQNGTVIASPGPFVTPTPAPALGITATPSVTPEGTAPAAGTPSATSAAGTPDAGQPTTGASPPAGTPTARPTVPTRPGAATGSSPFFAQVDPTWGGKEYDHGFRQDVGCGSTIAQCGCAMTSVATILSLFQLMTTPDGQPLNPDSLNAWFNQGATLTKDGWVSQGYVYGNVVWTSVASFSSAAAQQDPSAARLRYSRWGSGSEQEIRTELQAGRPVILEVPGHYIAAVALDGNDIIINDPAYRDRVTLDAYKGKVVSSRLFEASNDQGAIVVTVPANLRVRVTDSQGRVVGILGSDSVSSSQDKAKEDIPGSQYRFESAWRDPTCTERPPPPEAGVNTILIPSPAEGSYKVEVENPDGGSTSVSVHSYDEDGNPKLDTHESDGNTEVDVDYDPNEGATVTPGGGGGATTGPRFVDVTESRFPKLAASSLDAAMVDVDRDGDLDMVIGNGRFVFQDTPPASRDTGSRAPTPEQNLVLINDGEGVFALPEVDRLPPGPSTTLTLVPADFDGDGDIDLFIGDDGAPQKLLLNNGLGVFTPGPAIPGAGSPIRTAQAADVNGDRLPDLLIAPGDREDATPRLLINAGGGSFREAGLPGVKGKAVNHLAPGDADGDGDLDVFVALGGSNKPLLWLNDGSGGFVDASNRLPGAKLDAQKAALADLDGDGDVDIMVAALKGGSRLYVNDGEGKFSDLTGARMPEDLQAVDIQFADFDRDGDVDGLLVGSLILLANDGKAFFSDVSGLLPPVPGNTRAARWGDVDNDGDLDLTVMRFNSKYNVLLMNTVDDSPVVIAPTATPTPTPSATDTPAATLRPGVTPTITPTSAPATVSVRVDSNKVFFPLGENVPVCYTVNRPQEIVLDLVSPRGDRTNLITGRDDGTGDCFPIDMSNRRVVGDWRIELTGENDASDFSTFKVAPPLTIVTFGPAAFVEVAPCSITIPWQVTGDPTITVDLLLNNQVVGTSREMQGQFQTTYTPGTLVFQLRIRDSSGELLSDRLLTQSICVRYFTATYVASCPSGAWNRLRWLVDGNPPATWKLQRRFKASVSAPFGPWVDNAAPVPVTYGVEQTYDDAPHNMASLDGRYYQYRIVVMVGDRVVMSNPAEVQYKVLVCIF